MTSFQTIYDRFMGKITDDMYMDGDKDNVLWSEQDTINDCKNMLQDAIPGFEFPRFRLYEYNCGNYENSEFFIDDLTSEEINILAILMLNTWVQRQMTSIENTRMKYSGSDFKMTSQANHLSKLINLKTETERMDRHYQRLYKRRKINDDQKIESNWSILRKVSTIDDN